MPVPILCQLLACELEELAQIFDFVGFVVRSGIGELDIIAQT